ncbi:MAG: peptidoglycan-binding protein [Actinomycetia bacterium]|nr:peptidoglycan-binding protein [Actinomycetes bacterium]
MATKWYDNALGELQEAFPDLKAGHWNCRFIVETTKYSEHAWGNAGDLYHKDWGYSTNAWPQAYLDEVYAWIRTYFEELSIRTLIWRKKDHFNHIHIDGWPKGYGTPPCAGGTLRMQQNNGTVVFADPGPANGIIELPDKELITVTDNQHLEKGDEGFSVAVLQRNLIDVGYNLGAWDPFNSDFPPGADGKYGGATVTAVTSFQEDNALTVTGKADGVTLHFLREKLGFGAGGGELVKHTHDLKLVIPGQTITTTTGVGEA